MPDREFIIGEIKRVATKIGRPPGRQVFENETGIRMPEWYGVHWRSWGDALEEAGLEANKRQGKLSSTELLQSYAEAVRHFGRIPAEVDIRMYSRERTGLPGHTTISNHFGNKRGLLQALSRFVQDNDTYSDIAELIQAQNNDTTKASSDNEGYVYLLKSGAHYKIGRSEDVERRIKQVSVSLPEEVTLEHVIRTDDPSGIEAYWHKRFADKRRNGEWFALSPVEIRAFKRRKYQ